MKRVYGEREQVMTALKGTKELVRSRGSNGRLRHAIIFRFLSLIYLCEIILERVYLSTIFFSIPFVTFQGHFAFRRPFIRYV